MEFKVGEVAIYWRPGSEMHGQECTVTAPVALRNIYDQLTGRRYFGLEYKVAHANGFNGCAAPSELRKKGDDANRVVSWDECLWRPKELAHV